MEGFGPPYNMALLNITPSLFVDRFEISLGKHNNSEEQLQRYIDKYETIYLQDLLGVDLFNLFKADIVDGEPQTQIYIDIWEAFAYDKSNVSHYSNNYCCYDYYVRCKGIIRSLGMVEMLVALIYSQYLKDQKYPNTIQGNIGTLPENAEKVNFNEMGWYIRQNEGIDSYHAIQQRILDNKQDYSDFNGQSKKYVSWL